jgi:dGTPase
VQAQPLAHLRFPVALSAGRRYPEVPHPYRNDFQRDRDRIVHARAFRRLEDKTQVFTAGLSDHFRNRLTHTIEVAQIARTLASALGLNEDLTEALALAHDMGHPPFAHSGEEELDRQMRRFGDCFDHNLHSLRIVERFEQRYARFPGLNLTFELREGIVKHSRDYDPGQAPALAEYRLNERPPLEAQLIDSADEIAYNTADLDDAYSAQMFGIDQLSTAVPHYADFWETVNVQFGGAPERVRFAEALRMLIDWLVTGLIEGTAHTVLDAGTANIQAVREWPRRLVRFTDPAAETNSALKTFLRAHVYFSDALAAERQRSVEAIAQLFEFFLRHPSRLPEAYQTEAEPLHRTVCDYIAGMTDGYFRRIYQQMLEGNGRPTPPAGA